VAEGGDGRRQARRPRLGVLISGRGSNLQALILAIERGHLAAEIGVVISNRAHAGGIELARAAGIEALVLDHRQFATREVFDERIAQELRAREVSLVCLAGFMRLVSRRLLEAFPDAVLNIHPSLLPSFPGVNAQQQALEHGVKMTGATVHLVTGELDGGPIVLQACVPVEDGDTIDTLSQRILVEEHRIYPEAVGILLSGGWRIDGRRFVRTG
jgi:phosphoribosylglycinamide formyltransferase 1